MFEFLSTNCRKTFSVLHTTSLHYPQDRMEANADIISEFAVLVFVHGESWSWGSSHLYDARILATLGRIIVVTFNYRLGVFGRLYLFVLLIVKCPLQSSPGCMFSQELLIFTENLNG